MRGLNQWGLGMEANHQIVCLNIIVKKEAPVLLHCVYQLYQAANLKADLGDKRRHRFGPR